MSNLYWIALIALAESTLLLILLLVVGALLLRRRSRREADAAAVLAARFAENVPQRQTELRTYLLREYMLDDPELQQQVDKMTALEGHFHSELQRIWCERDSDGLQTLDQQLNAVLMPYLDLRSAPASKEPSRASVEIARLTTLLDQSAAELVLYRDTLNTVFNEYTAMFGSRVDSKEQLTAEEIIKRLKEGLPEASSK